MAREFRFNYLKFFSIRKNKKVINQLFEVELLPWIVPTFHGKSSEQMAFFSHCLSNWVGGRQVVNFFSKFI